MKGENKQNSILKSKSFEIPVDQYKEEINSLLSKEKKDKILDLFKNSNQLRSEEEFKEIECNLHTACSMGDIDLIQIYLSEKIENSTKGMTFKINRTKKTASLFKVRNIEHLVIPRTFQYESIEYLITSITGTDSNVESIEFLEDSAVNTIFYSAFLYSKIEEIYFPTSLRELGGGWCYGVNITKIIISPSNDQFIFNKDKYLLGKTDPTSDEFDKLLFVRSDIKEISIPSNIKIISPFAFSDLEIEEISIPSKVTTICECAFCNCYYLRKVDISPNSNLQTIGLHAFYNTRIEEIYFPTSLRELREGWCANTKELTQITISPSNDQFTFNEDDYLLGKTDPTSDEFDKFLFARRDIKEISIPSNIKIISSCAFDCCENLTKVEIPANSNLQIIGSNAFSESKIKEIFIPSKVSAIYENAFFYCNNLTKVEISPNSNLQTIGLDAFYNTRIEEIYFPMSLRELGEGWCANTYKLTKIIISPSNDQLTFNEDKYLLGKTDPTSDEFDKFLFARRDIKEISIPPNIKIISSFAFSDLEIEEISIPSKVTTICECAFSICKNLTKVEISPNSDLQTIGSHAFSFSKIKEIFIPSKVSTICKSAFSHCKNLQIIEFAEESILKSISLSAFDECPEFIIMAPPPSLRK